MKNKSHTFQFLWLILFKLNGIWSVQNFKRIFIGWWWPLKHLTYFLIYKNWEHSVYSLALRCRFFYLSNFNYKANLNLLYNLNCRYIWLPVGFSNCHKLVRQNFIKRINNCHFEIALQSITEFEQERHWLGRPVVVWNLIM